MSDIQKSFAIVTSIVIAVLLAIWWQDGIKQEKIKNEGRTIFPKASYVCQDNNVYLLQNGEYREIHVGLGRNPDKLKCDEF